MGTSRLSLSAYRPRPGRDDEVLPHLREEVATLRARGYITSRPAPICRTAKGEYLVIAEWATETSVDEAHRDEVILEIWRRKEQLLEYLAAADLDHIDIPFARLRRPRGRLTAPPTGAWRRLDARVAMRRPACQQAGMLGR